jgi:hypothetical protein
MERNLRRYKGSAFPSSPLNATGVLEVFEQESVNKHFGMSQHEIPNQFYKGTQVTANFENTFFASDKIIELIKKNIPSSKRSYFMDATFKIVPIGSFRQILIIYIEYIGKVFQIQIFYLYIHLKLHLHI